MSEIDKNSIMKQILVNKEIVIEEEKKQTHSFYDCLLE